MAKKPYYMSINDVKKLLKKCSKEFDVATKEYFEDQLDNKDLIKLYNNAVEVFCNIVTKLLDNLEEYKKE